MTDATSHRVRPILLDLFCGAGGCAMGYYRAGFDIVGVDIVDQPAYPFPFVRADALELGFGRFDAVHASPPCQDYSKAMRHLAAPQPRLIDPTRALLQSLGVPYVIENVEGAPLPRASTLTGEHGVELCGTMFGLRVWRHRLFETSFPISAPRGCDHNQPAMNPHNQAGRDRIYAEFGRQDPDPIWNAAMGVPWMGRYEGREAVPPAYTAFIGARVLDLLGVGNDDAIRRDRSGDLIRDLIGRASVVVGDGGVHVDQDGAGHVASSSGCASEYAQPAFDVKDDAA